MNNKGLYNEIVNLIAFHKKELVANVKKLGYVLNDNKDATVIEFIFTTAEKDNRVAEVIAQMVVKYNKDTTLLDGGETKSGIVLDFLGDITKGVTGIFQAKEETKTAQVNAQAQMMSQLLAMKQQQDAPKGVSTGVIIAIVVGVVALSVVLVFALKTSKSQTINTQTQTVKV